MAKMKAYLDELADRQDAQAAELARAKNAAAAMTEATERLNAAIEAAERRLASFNFGVTAGVIMVPRSADGQWPTSLRFAKDGKEWRLLLSTGDWEDEDPPIETPLASASRDSRIAALKVLPALFKALIDKAETESSELTRHVGTVEEFLKQLDTK
jgi:hypothetical protein